MDPPQLHPNFLTDFRVACWVIGRGLGQVQHVLLIREEGMCCFVNEAA